MYQKGHGVLQDYEEAVKWFRLAAEQENPDAQIEIALKFKFDFVISKNFVNFLISDFIT